LYSALAQKIHMEDIVIESAPISGGGESLWFDVPPYFDAFYVVSLIILAIIVILVLLALSDSGPLAKPLAALKTAIGTAANGM
jgi:hypothetical protein